MNSFSTRKLQWYDFLWGIHISWQYISIGLYIEEDAWHVSTLSDSKFKLGFWGWINEWQWLIIEINKIHAFLIIVEDCISHPGKVEPVYPLSHGSWAERADSWEARCYKLQSCSQKTNWAEQKEPEELERWRKEYKSRQRCPPGKDGFSSPGLRGGTWSVGPTNVLDLLLMSVQGENHGASI